MTKKLLIILIVGVIAGGAVIGGIFAWKYWQVLKQEEEPQPQEEGPESEPEVQVPADWKTYRNEEYGFEVKYPTKWPNPEISGRTVSWDITSIVSFRIFSGIPTDELLLVENPELVKDLEKWVKTERWKGGGGFNREFRNWLIVDGHKAVKADVGSIGTDEIHVYIGEDEILFDISFTVVTYNMTFEEGEKYKKVDREKYEKTLDAMISTFRFIE